MGGTLAAPNSCCTNRGMHVQPCMEALVHALAMKNPGKSPLGTWALLPWALYLLQYKLMPGTQMEPNGNRHAEQVDAASILMLPVIAVIQPKQTSQPQINPKCLPLCQGLVLDDRRVWQEVVPPWMS